MSLYLCVDCGGSKTSAVICDVHGKILGRAYGGPSNFAYLGPDAFTLAVRTAVSDALKTVTDPASIDPIPLPPADPVHHFAQAWFGISGVDGPAAVVSCTALLSELLGIPPGPRLNVCNDTYLLAAPLRLHKDAKYAVTAIAGTGSCVVSFCEEEDGRLQELGRTGGWGWLFGDEGGGFHVGREAVRQMLLQADAASLGGEQPPSGPKTMRAGILKHYAVESPMEVLVAAHIGDPAPGFTFTDDMPVHATMVREKRLSALAPIVFDAAFTEGDPLALSVLRKTASELVDQIALMLRSEAEEDPRRPRAVKASETVLCFGGSLVGVENYRQLIIDILAERGHTFRHIKFVADAAATGAAGLARMAAEAKK
jgi:N-acetylglucosamine kinase-like BadF-type ATPase